MFSKLTSNYRVCGGGSAPLMSGAVGELLIAERLVLRLDLLDLRVLHVLLDLLVLQEDEILDNYLVLLGVQNLDRHLLLLLRAVLLVELCLGSLGSLSLLIHLALVLLPRLLLLLQPLLLRDQSIDVLSHSDELLLLLLICRISVEQASAVHN